MTLRHLPVPEIGPTEGLLQVKAVELLILI